MLKMEECVAQRNYYIHKGKEASNIVKYNREN